MGMKVNGTSGLTFPDTTTLASAGQSSVQAWVNFNGTGTVAIRASYNVSSITDNGTGDYTVNFTTAMEDGSYAASGITQFADDGTNNGVVHAIGIRRGVAPTTTACRFTTTGLLASAANMTDQFIVCVSIFR